MRERMENQLKVINEMILKMSILVEDNIELSIKTLTSRELELADVVIKNDLKINEYEEKIEDMCIQFIATQNPVGSDLRRIFSILKIITDLERIGDHAENIARITKKIGHEKLIKPLVDIPKMTVLCREMVSNSINSYINQDLDMAVITAKMDDQVDDLYEKIYMELLDLIEVKKENKNQIIGLLLVGRYLERIADHSTNICERVAFMITGIRIDA